MNPQYALIILLTIAALRPFFEASDGGERARILDRAGYKPPAQIGCMYFLLLPVLLGLWWWYALATDQILLGLIPTVGVLMGLLVKGIQIAQREQTKKVRA